MNVAESAPPDRPPSRSGGAMLLTDHYQPRWCVTCPMWCSCPAERCRSWSSLGPTYTRGQPFCGWSHSVPS